MRTSLRVLGILAVVGAATMVTATTRADDVRFNVGGGPRWGGGRGGPGPGPQPVTSIPNQFFGQTVARQQSFFSQSVFPSSNYMVTPMFQPGLRARTSQVVVIPSQLSYVGGSPSWSYSNSGYYSIGGGLIQPPSGLVSIGGGLFPTPTAPYYTAPPVITIYNVTPTYMPAATPIQQMGLIGRW
jgi:hypothetical protein